MYPTPPCGDGRGAGERRKGEVPLRLARGQIYQHVRVPGRGESGGELDPTMGVVLGGGRYVTTRTVRRARLDGEWESCLDAAASESEHSERRLGGGGSVG